MDTQRQGAIFQNTFAGAAASSWAIDNGTIAALALEAKRGKKIMANFMMMILNMTRTEAMEALVVIK